MLILDVSVLKHFQVIVLRYFVKTMWCSLIKLTFFVLECVKMLYTNNEKHFLAFVSKMYEVLCILITLFYS
jgi:hypothetical protein